MGQNLTRKQREIAEREQLILRVARDMLVERGYLGLSMERIAEAIEYSKGTVYQHFRSKEDLLAAIGADNQVQLGAWFQRAATLRGSPRERMVAIAIGWRIFAELHPAYLRSEHILCSSSVCQKVGQTNLMSHQVGQSRCFDTVLGVVHDGVAQEELILPEGVTPETVVYGLWTLSFGASIVEASGVPIAEKGITDAADALMRNQSALLDGYGWKPLSSDMDLEALQQRTLTEIFPAEARQLGLL